MFNISTDKFSVMDSPIFVSLNKPMGLYENSSYDVVSKTSVHKASDVTSVRIYLPNNQTLELNSVPSMPLQAPSVLPAMLPPSFKYEFGSGSYFIVYF